jgi:hypothetical protein
LRATREKLTGTWLKQNLDFLKVMQIFDKTILRWSPSDGKWKRFRLFLNPATDDTGAQTFLWAGGTYARREADFSAEQSTSTWLETHMRVLGIEAPGFRFCCSPEQILKTWERAEWYGTAPHRRALQEAFPYATASMQEFHFGRVVADPRGPFRSVRPQNRLFGGSAVRSTCPVQDDVSPQRAKAILAAGQRLQVSCAGFSRCPACKAEFLNFGGALIMCPRCTRLAVKAR